MVIISAIELREIAADVTTALISQLITPAAAAGDHALRRGRRHHRQPRPSTRPAASGLFTSFFDVLDNDLLIAKPVVLAATAGTARHALVARPSCGRCSPTCVP